MMVPILNFLFFRGERLEVGQLNATTRDDWVKKALSELPAAALILDAGAGECQYRPFCQHLNYVSQDLAQYDGSGNTAGLQTGKWDTTSIDLVSDITNIPADDASFDVVLCTEVLEHLTDPSLALKEFARLLRPGGKLILTAPFCSLTHFAPYHFATGFNRYFYSHHLDKYGFDNIDISENGNFFEFVAQELRRVDFCARQYADTKISWLSRLAINVLLYTLSKLSMKDKGSKELLNFGLHVIATRGSRSKELE